MLQSQFFKSLYKHKKQLSYIGKVSMLLFVFLFMSIISNANSLVFAPKTVKKGRIDIPFTFENSFIILKVMVNNTFPVKFILDSGAEHTIITKKEITDLLQIDYERRIEIRGTDMESDLFALLARGIDLKFENYHAPKQSILVLEEDYLKFEEINGINVQGILGMNLFRNYVVNINYKKAMISLYEREEFEKKKKKYTHVPVEVARGKPYLNSQVYIEKDNPVNLKLLLDTGASIALLLHYDSHTDINLPEDYIEGNLGIGLGGYLKGFLSRTERLELAEFSFNNIITNFQEKIPTKDLSIFNNRNGIIGNLLLSRFEIAFDLRGASVYLRKNSSYKDKFHYDKSGLVIFATGKDLKTFYVNQVKANTPAAEADIRRGDVIQRINVWNSKLITLDDLNRVLQKKAGKRIKLKIKRGDEILVMKFRLRDLI